MEAKAMLGGADFVPAIQVVHAPVFYGTAFAASASFDPSRSGLNGETIVGACKAAGVLISADPGDAPSNVTVAGEKSIHSAVPQEVSGRRDTWWCSGRAEYSGLR